MADYEKTCKEKSKVATKHNVYHLCTLPVAHTEERQRELVNVGLVFLLHYIHLEGTRSRLNREIEKKIMISSHSCLNGFFLVSK